MNLRLVKVTLYWSTFMARHSTCSAECLPRAGLLLHRHLMNYFRLRRVHHCHVVGRLFVAYASRDRLDSVSSSREGTDRYALQWRLAETKKSTLSRANDHPKICSKASLERKEKIHGRSTRYAFAVIFDSGTFEKNWGAALKVHKSMLLLQNIVCVMYIRLCNLWQISKKND